MDFSFTDMEVVASSHNNSFLSDLDNDSLSHLSLSSLDFQPNEDVVYDHDAVVRQRLDIEAQLRALQASDDEEDDKLPLSSGEDFKIMLAVDDNADLISNTENLRGGNDSTKSVEKACGTPDKASASNRPLQRFVPEVVVSLPGSPCRKFAEPSPIKRLPDSPVRPCVAAKVADSNLDEQDSPLHASTAAIIKLSPTNSPARSTNHAVVRNNSDVDCSPPASPLKDLMPTCVDKHAVNIDLSAPSEPAHQVRHATKIGSEGSQGAGYKVNADDRSGEGNPDDVHGPSVTEVDAQLAETKEASDTAKGSDGPVLNLEESKARLNRKFASAPMTCAAESDDQLVDGLPKDAKASLCDEQGIDVSLSLQRSSRRTNASQRPLDESIASEEESQLFQVPYNHQSPTFGFVVSSASSQSDSLVVNQSVDDSVVDHNSEDKERRALSQPRVLLSSLQSPTSVLDARETLEIAEKVEAHVHDVLHRYRSEELHQS